MAIINRDGVFCIDCFNEKIDDPTFNLCDACGKHYDGYLLEHKGQFICSDCFDEIIRLSKDDR